MACSILFVTVQGEHRTTGEIIHSKLVMVDLAGSERVGRTDAVGARLKEAQFINKSLSALGDVIASLKTHQAHTPFRNSKLTFLLQDCLSGNSKSLMFCNVSPEEDDRNESICSLKFAERVRAVTLGPTQKSSSAASLEATKLKSVCQKLKDEARNAKEKYEDAINQLQSSKLAFIQLEKDSKAKFTESSSLQTKLNDKEREFRDLQAQLIAARSEIEKLNRQNTSLLVSSSTNSDFFKVSTPRAAARTPKAFESRSRVMTPVASAQKRPTTPSAKAVPIRLDNKEKSSHGTPFFSRSLHIDTQDSIRSKSVPKKRSAEEADVPRTTEKLRSKKHSPNKDADENVNATNLLPEMDAKSIAFVSTIDSKKRVRFNQLIGESASAPSSPKRAPPLSRPLETSKSFSQGLLLRPKDKFKQIVTIGSLGAPSRVVSKTTGWK